MSVEQHIDLVVAHRTVQVVDRHNLEEAAHHMVAGNLVGIGVLARHMVEGKQVGIEVRARHIVAEEHRMVVEKVNLDIGGEDKEREEPRSLVEEDSPVVDSGLGEAHHMAAADNLAEGVERHIDSEEAAADREVEESLRRGQSEAGTDEHVGYVRGGG